MPDANDSLGLAHDRLRLNRYTVGNEDFVRVSGNALRALSLRRLGSEVQAVVFEELVQGRVDRRVEPVELAATRFS